MRAAILAMIFGTGVTACAPAPMPFSQSMRDPSNPAAAEAAPPPGASAAVAAATAYACPMHPEVTSEKPGRCPKCGMNLVPKP